MVDRRSPDDGSGAAIAHVPALDGVRGTAIALVLALHFGVGADIALRSGSGIARWTERILYVGWAGVDLFFVLSGFLITTILLASRDGPQYFRRFYGRRILRIFPLYYTALILGLVILPLLAAEPAWGLLQPGATGDVWLWTYTLNIGLALGLIANPIAFLSHFWTLAIEEQYYLVWPWLAKALSPRALLGLCALLMVISLVMRIAWVGLGFGWEGAYRFTLTRADSLATGSAVAVLMLDRSWRDTLLRVAPVGLATAVGVLALLFLSVPRFYPSDPIVVTLGHSIIGITSAFLIIFALRRPSSGWFAGAPLRALGKYSYGIYVWHFPLQRILLYRYGVRPDEPAQGGLTNAFVFLSVGLVGSVLVGWISYRLIERPFLRLKRFFVYSTDGSLETLSHANDAPVRI